LAGGSFVPVPCGPIHGRQQPPSAALASSALAGSLLAAPAWANAAATALPVAPSGVNALPESQQAAVVLAIFIGLALDTWGLLFLFDKLRSVLPEGWFENWQKTWPLAGIAYMAAGSAHFTAPDAFRAIFPPVGTWGIWYLPGSAEFHVAWTGAAEIMGGAGLFLGSVILGLASIFRWEVPALFRQLHALSALGLFVLTIAVSPSNIYMYTHGAQMIGLTPSDVPVPVEGHYARAALQALLLSILWGYYEYARPKAVAE